MKNHLENNSEVSLPFYKNKTLLLAFTLALPLMFLVFNKKTETVGFTVDSQKYDKHLADALKAYSIKNYEESILLNRKAIEINPSGASAYNNLGVCYNELRMWDKAIEAFNTAIEIKSDFELARNNLNWAKSQSELEKNQ